MFDVIPALIQQKKEAVITYDPVTGPGLRKQQGTPIESQASVLGGPRPYSACARGRDHMWFRRIFARIRDTV